MNRFVKLLAAALSICCLSGCSLPQINIPGLSDWMPKKEAYISGIPQDTTAQPETAFLIPSEAATEEAPTSTEIASEEVAATTEAVPENTPDTTGSASLSEEAHAARINQIRQWYQEIVSNPNLEVKTYTTEATVYRLDGQIVSITENRQLNDAYNTACALVHFYYREDVPFFIFIEFENCEYDYEDLRLYFSSEGQLIRWLTDQNEPHDNEANAQWQDYYTQACASLERAKNLQ